jgi:pimeloyl-ACP methyl ester carboxylesterase
MMAAQPTSHRLGVPGAQLYYEVRGSGPLLLVVGQPMTSGPFGPLADLLADRYTVVTYDPHGVGESTVDDPSLPVTPEVEADDLANIIDEVGGGPADVFGTSGGAVAGLALAVRHPDKVRTLVAHEPPIPELLPDASHIHAVVSDIEDTYRAYGTGAAWGKFVPLVMYSGLVTEAGVPPVTWPPAGAEDEGPAGSEGQGAAGSDGQAAAGDEVDAGQMPPAPSEKQQADDELFFLRMLKPFLSYEPLVDALRSGAPRVVIGIGETSQEEIPARSSRALAERLRTTPAPFPGHHAGFMADPAGFARTISEVLTEKPAEAKPSA